MSGRRLVLLLLAGGALTLAPAVSASAQTVLATGVLRDGAGKPSAGSVRVYAWPRHKEAMSLPLVGEARADANGTFVVPTRGEAQLGQLAQQRFG